METGAEGTRTTIDTLDPNTLRDRDLIIRALLALDSPDTHENSLAPPVTPFTPPVSREYSPVTVPETTEIDDYSLIVRALRSLESPPPEITPIVEPPVERTHRFTKRKVLAIAGAMALSLSLIHGVSSQDTTDTRFDAGKEAVTEKTDTATEDGEKSQLLEERSEQRAKSADTEPPIVEAEEQKQKQPKNSKEEKKADKPRTAEDKPDRKEKAKSHETPAKSYIRPVGYEYEITCPLGGYENLSGFHTGVDYGTPANTIVLAPKGGVVVGKGYSGGAGKYLIIKHSDGRRSIFQHLNSYFVDVGEGVEQGAEIARTGSTGTEDDHLHWTLTKPGVGDDGDIPSRHDEGVEHRVENPQNFYD